MCGELDDDAAMGQELCNRMRRLAASHDLASPQAPHPPRNLAEAEGRSAYIDHVFHSGLASAIAEITAAEDEEAVDALALQAIALARLAGVLAGHLPAEADLVRAVIEAATNGYGERARMDAAHEHGRHHH